MAPITPRTQDRSINQPQDRIDPETDEDSEATDEDSDATDEDSDAPTDPVTRRHWRRHRAQARQYARDEVEAVARIDALNADAIRRNGIVPGFFLSYPANQRGIDADLQPLPEDLLPDPEDMYGFEMPNNQPVMGFQTPPRPFRVVQPPWAPPRPINPRHIINDNADDADDDDEDLPPAPPCLRRLDGQDGFGRPNGPDMGPRGGPGMDPCG